MWSYLAFSRHSLSLLSAVTCPICHCLQDHWDGHTSSPPRLHDHIPSSLLSLALLQLSSQQLLKHTPMSSDHPGYSLQPWENTSSTHREEGWKISHHLSFLTCTGFSDRSWVWLSSYFSDMVVGMKKRGWTQLLFRTVIWQNLVIVFNEAEGEVEDDSGFWFGELGGYWLTIFHLDCCNDFLISFAVF